jgi:hypothetical protein
LKAQSYQDLLDRIIYRMPGRETRRGGVGVATGEDVVTASGCSGSPDRVRIGPTGFPSDLLSFWTDVHIVTAAPIRLGLRQRETSPLSVASGGAEYRQLQAGAQAGRLVERGSRMNRYQLAKLVSWANCLHTRKRLQKVVYLLQAAGCPLEAEFSLHHYGPYSEELARLTDEMVRQALLDECSSDNMMGKQYTYTLSPAAEQQITELEGTDLGRGWAAELARFEPTAKELLVADLKQLEYASTIVYFHNQGCDWPTAVEKAVTFKKTPAVKNALPLAQKVAS